MALRDHHPGTWARSPALLDLERLCGVRLRAGKLTKKLWRACQHSAEAIAYMRKRVSNANRWDSWTNGLTTFTGSKPCPRCRSFRMRTVDSHCHSCHVGRRPIQLNEKGRYVLKFTNMGAGTIKAIQQRQKAEKARADAGEHVAMQFGPWLVRHYPNDRVEVLNQERDMHIRDLREQIPWAHKQFEVDNDFARLVDFIGWT